ncbi:hypothetical protein FB451DRAFT_1372425 [Mycena latifolia]|nr:hypothetical protein FB451DRAFT_1372425 [Mycena latifolia]
MGQNHNHDYPTKAPKTFCSSNPDHGAEGMTPSVLDEYCREISRPKERTVRRSTIVLLVAAGVLSRTTTPVSEEMDSPFERHLRSNYTPTDEEVSSIRAYLAPHVDELARLVSLIHDLSARRDQIKEHISLHETLISPVRRIPHDILQEIFLACLPANRNPTMSTTEAPLLLCRISAEQRITFVTEWLARSAQCDLALAYSGLDLESFGTLMDVLVRSFPRWRSISLRDLPRHCLEKLEGVAAPMLEAIELTGIVAAQGTSTLFRGDHLRRVSLVQRDLKFFLQNLPVAWDRLTHLSLVDKDDSRWVESTFAILLFLRRCPALLSIRFQMGSSADSAPITEERVTLPSLQTMVIHPPFSTPSTPLFDLMDHLSMPELRHLRIPNTALALSSTDGTFFTTLASGSPKLESLEVHLGSLTRDPLFESLRSFLALESLRITDLNFSAYWDRPNRDLAYVSAEDLLIFLFSDSTVCPELRDVEIREAHVTEEALFVFAFNRLQNGNRLRRLHVKFRIPRPSTSPIVDIRAFCSLGIDMTLEYLPSTQTIVASLTP